MSLRGFTNVGTSKPWDLSKVTGAICHSTDNWWTLAAKKAVRALISGVLTGSNKHHPAPADINWERVLNGSTELSANRLQRSSHRQPWRKKKKKRIVFFFLKLDKNKVSQSSYTRSFQSTELWLPDTLRQWKLSIKTSWQTFIIMTNLTGTTATFILLKVLINKNSYFYLDKHLLPSLTIWQGCSVSLAVSLISP